MRRKLFKSGNSIVVSLPQEYLNEIRLETGSEIQIVLDRENRQILLKSPSQNLEGPGITSEFTQHLDDFISEYRPVLEKLARE